MQNRTVEKGAWPVRVTMATMRRKRAEPPNESEVKVHLIGVELISAKKSGTTVKKIFIHSPRVYVHTRRNF